MAKIYGALEVAQLEWFTDAGKPAASSYIYRVIYVSDLKQVMVSDGSNWIPFLNTSTNQTVNGNITFAGQQIFNGLHRLSVTTDSSSTGAVTALNNTTPVIEFTAAVTSISGIVNSASGATVMLVNRTGGTIAVLDEDAGATAANRIRTGTGAQISLANNASIILTYVGDNRWHIVGGSGSGSGSAGINYITNGSAEADTLGWTVYAESDAVTFQDTGDTVTRSSHGLSNGNQISFTSITSTTGISTNTLYYVINATTNTFQVATTATGSALPLTTDGSGTMVRFVPKTGSGGSPSVTITRNTTNPLIGTASFILTKDAANRQGQGWDFDFTIDRGYQAKVLQISFQYLVNSGTFVAGTSTSVSDVTVWIYDVTNGVMIQPSSINLLSNNASVSDTFNATFQTAANSTSYRLIFHVATPSTAAYSLKVDGISVSPSTYVYGTPVTDWQNYTPTFQGFGTPTNVEMRWRRVGDNVEIQGRFTSGTSTAVEARVGLPPGLTSSSTKISTIQPAGGTIAFNQFTTATWFTLMEPSVTYLTFSAQGSSNQGLTKVLGNQVALSGYVLSFAASVPVQGWSSSVQTSDQADTRVVVARAQRTINQSVNNNTATKIQLDLTNEDSHAAWDSTNYRYVVPVSGRYIISGSIAISFGGNNGVAAALLYVDGSEVDRRGNSYTLNASITTNFINFVFERDLRAGQYIELFTIQINSGAGALTVLGNNTNNGLTSMAIFRLSGPSAIAATETVSASYWANAITSITAGNPFQFAGKDWDTHNAVTTGANWKFTAPISGKYLFEAWINPNSAPSGSLGFDIYKNGAFLQSVAYMISTQAWANVNSTINLNAGDYIDLRPSLNYSLYGNASRATQYISHVQITRIGN